MLIIKVEIQSKHINVCVPSLSGEVNDMANPKKEDAIKTNALFKFIY